MTERFPNPYPEQEQPNTVTEIEVLPGVYEVYDDSGELVDISNPEEEY